MISKIGKLFGGAIAIVLGIIVLLIAIIGVSGLFQYLMHIWGM